MAFIADTSECIIPITNELGGSSFIEAALAIYLLFTSYKFIINSLKSKNDLETQLHAYIETEFEKKANIKIKESLLDKEKYKAFFNTIKTEVVDTIYSSINKSLEKKIGERNQLFKWFQYIFIVFVIICLSFLYCNFQGWGTIFLILPMLIYLIWSKCIDFGISRKIKKEAATIIDYEMDKQVTESKMLNIGDSIKKIIK